MDFGTFDILLYVSMLWVIMMSQRIDCDVMDDNTMRSQEGLCWLTLVELYLPFQFIQIQYVCAANLKKEEFSQKKETRILKKQMCLKFIFYIMYEYH